MARISHQEISHHQELHYSQSLCQTAMAAKQKKLNRKHCQTEAAQPVERRPALYIMATFGCVPHSMKAGWRSGTRREARRLPQGAGTVGRKGGRSRTLLDLMARSKTTQDPHPHTHQPKTSQITNHKSAKISEPIFRLGHPGVKPRREEKSSADKTHIINVQAGSRHELG